VILLSVDALYLSTGVTILNPLTNVNPPRRKKVTPDEAMRFFGSQNKMAWAFGVTPPAVLRWRRSGKFPARREYELPVAIERHKTRLEGPYKPPEAAIPAPQGQGEA